MAEGEITVGVLVARTLGHEIQRVEDDLARADTTITRLQGEYDALRNTDADSPMSAAEEKANAALIRAVHHGTVISQKLQVLRSPSELERRINEKLANQQSIRRLLMSEATDTPTAPAKPTPADQGIPAQYLSDDGKKFLTGMDARLKSDLIASITGEITDEKPGASKHVFDEATARGILTARGWTGFLDRKVALLATKAASKEKAQKEREERARLAAEEKAKKDAEKKAADEAKAAAGESAPAASGKTAGSKAAQDRAQREAKAAAAA